MNRALASAILSLAAASPAFAGVKGTFTNKGVQYRVVDGVAYESKAYFGDGPAIRVALTRVRVDPAAIAAALDVEEAVKAQRADGPYVDLEFRPDGEWVGASYVLASGNGCGWCQDGKASAKLAVADGSLRGVMKVASADYSDGEGPAIDLVFDLPIVKVATTPLPADGGPAGKAFLLCRQYVKAKDLAAMNAARQSCFAPDDKLLAMGNVGEGPDAVEPFWSIALLYERDSLKSPSMTITGGRTKGDWAELFVEGRDEYDQKKKGSVFFRKQADGTWRYHHERLEMVF